MLQKAADLWGRHPLAHMLTVVWQIILLCTQGQTSTQAIKAEAALLKPLAWKKAAGVAEAHHHVADLHSF